MHNPSDMKVFSSVFLPWWWTLLGFGKTIFGRPGLASLWLPWDLGFLITSSKRESNSRLSSTSNRSLASLTWLSDRDKFGLGTSSSTDEESCEGPMVGSVEQLWSCTRTRRGVFGKGSLNSGVRRLESWSTGVDEGEIHQGVHHLWPFSGFHLQRRLRRLQEEENSLA